MSDSEKEKMEIENRKRRIRRIKRDIKLVLFLDLRNSVIKN